MCSHGGLLWIVVVPDSKVSLFDVILSVPPPCLHTRMIFRSLEHSGAEPDSPPLSVPMNELLLEQAVLLFGSLILLDGLILVAAIFPGTIGHFFPPHPQKPSWFTLLKIAIANRFQLACESRFIPDLFLCSALQQNLYRPLKCDMYTLNFPGFHRFVFATAPANSF